MSLFINQGVNQVIPNGTKLLERDVQTCLPDYSQMFPG
jgi:hypothetical protein